MNLKISWFKLVKCLLEGFVFGLIIFIFSVSAEAQATCPDAAGPVAFGLGLFFAWYEYTRQTTKQTTPY